MSFEPRRRPRAEGDNLTPTLIYRPHLPIGQNWAKLGKIELNVFGHRLSKQVKVWDLVHHMQDKIKKTGQSRN